MIPSDLAARLRMLTEASFFEADQPVNATTRVREIQGRLPELAPGDRFTATVQRPLPDGTFEALVAGRNYTLALNHPASAGDTLELVVMQNTPRAVVAQLAHPAAETNAAASTPNLSSTGRLISFLLTGQPASPPAALAGGRPLVNAPPANDAAAKTLAPALREALTHSGLFYESHQMQWLSGRIDTAALRHEPQGQQPPLPTGQTATGTTAAGTTAAGTTAPGTTAPGTTVPGATMPGTSAPGTIAPGTPSPNETAADEGAAASMRPAVEPPLARAPGPAGNAAAALPGVEPAPGEPARDANQAAAVQSAAARAQPLPERLMPIVHQQLDAMATQNYVWQGQVWPGQHVEWEIEDPQRDRSGGDDEAPEHWNTTLRLTLPRLGGLEARLVLSPAGVALRLRAEDPATVATLDAARARLGDALAAANLPLTGFVAERRDGG